MRSLQLTEKRTDKTIIKNILHVNPNATDADCIKAAKALNSLSQNHLTQLEKLDRTELVLDD